MIVSRFLRWLSGWVHDPEVEQAERELEETRRRVEPIYEREPRVNRISSWLIADRAENHYAQRIRAALEGREN